MIIHENTSEYTVCEMEAILSRGRWVNAFPGYQQPWDGLCGITQVTEEKFGPSQGQEMMQMYFYASCSTDALTRICRSPVL